MCGTGFPGLECAPTYGVGRQVVIIKYLVVPRAVCSNCSRGGDCAVFLFFKRNKKLAAAVVEYGVESVCLSISQCAGSESALAQLRSSPKARRAGQLCVSLLLLRPAFGSSCRCCSFCLPLLAIIMRARAAAAECVCSTVDASRCIIGKPCGL